MSKTHKSKSGRTTERRRGRVSVGLRTPPAADRQFAKPYYKSFFILFFILGSLLRILLCWSNPPGNFFDNHFDPILLIMKTGTIPGKNDCWQCYHPPVFYWISAMAGHVAMHMVVKLSQLLKFFQFVVCFYSILTLGILYLLLSKLPLSNFSRLLAFGTACFLPRHIYMSAINSNDTISYLFVALSIYLLLIVIERKFPFFLLVTVSIVISVTLFTKYTSFIVLPVVLMVFASLAYKRLFPSRKQALLFFVLIIFVPMTILSAHLIWNKKHYDSPLPWNVNRSDPSLIQPRDGDHFDFFTFKPWESIDPPIIVPGRMQSFWTLVYSGMWFDNEPKFLYFLVSNQSWWDRYYGWLRGEEKFPEDSPSISKLTGLLGAGLTVLGLFPLLLMVRGFGNFFSRSWRSHMRAEEMVKMSIFPTLLFSNIVGIVALALRLPVYTAAKASYFLNSLPAFIVFLSLGLMACEKSKALKWTAVIAFSFLFCLASVHILHIVLSISFLKPANLLG
jgi:4-amino-4-deoxy-L-arabinose transferase-like glycosyltransferase